MRARVSLLGRPAARALVIGVVVGTVLVLINHGDHLAMEPVCKQFYLKAGLSYLTPLLVSLLSSWLSARERGLDDKEPST